MADRQDEVRIPIYINDEQAVSAFKNLKAEAEKYRKAMHQAQAAGDLQLAKKMEKELKGVEKQVNNIKKQNFDVNKVLNNLSNASRQDLIRTRRELMKHQDTLRRGTTEYKATANAIKKVKIELNSMNAELTQQRGFMSRAADGVNRYIGLIGGALATLTGFKLAAGKAVEMANIREEKRDNLQALTGLDEASVKNLESMAKRASTAVVEGNVRIKQSTDDIIDAYTLVGSQRPELLKNADALHAVTQDAIILSEAAKMELTPAAAALTNTLNQFQESADQSRRIINILAAGSQAGAGNIQYLSEAIEKTGTTANLMGMSIEQTVGAIETIAPFYKRAEMAGNSFDKVLLKLKAQQIGYKSGVFDLNDAIDELRQMYAAGTTSVDIFGVEHSKMGELLVQNQGELKRYTTAVSNSTKAIEQAAINTDNWAAKKAQAINKAKEYAVALGEKLQPAMVHLTSSGALFLKMLSALVDMLTKHGKTILITTSAIIAYTSAVKASTLIDELKVKWTNNVENSFKKLFSTIKLNPWGALFAALSVGVTLLVNYYNQQKKVSEHIKDFNKNLGQEKTELDNVFTALKNTKLGTNERAEAIRLVNEKYGEYLPNLLTEKSTLEDIQIAQEAVNNAIIKNAAIKSKTNEIERITSESLQKQKDIVDKIIQDIQDKKGSGAAGIAQAEILSIIDEIGKYDNIDDIKNRVGLFAKQYRDASKEIGTYAENWEQFTEILQIQADEAKQLDNVSKFYDSYIDRISKAFNINKKTNGGKKIKESDADKSSNNDYSELLEFREKYGLAKNRELLAKELADFALNEQSKYLTAKEYLEAVEKIKEKYTKVTSISLEPEEEVADDQALLDFIEKQKLMEKLKEDYKLKSIDELEAEEWAFFDKNFKLLEGTEQYEAARKEIEDKYREMREEKDNKEFDKKLSKAQNFFAKMASFAQMSGEIVNNIQASEFEDLESRRERGLIDEKQYQEESKKIKKKYADVQFGIAIAQIVADTAGSIMGTWKGYASFGPWGTAAAIAQTALLSGIGVTQIALAAKQRQSVKQLAKGKYDVIGLDDNQPYSANYTGRLSTGLVKQPTLVGEEPEVVWSVADTRKILTYNPMLVEASRNPQNFSVIPRVNQRSGGVYPDYTQTNTAQSGFDSGTLNRLADVLDRIEQNGVTALFGPKTTRDITTQQAEDAKLLQKAKW